MRHGCLILLLVAIGCAPGCARQQYQYGLRTSKTISNVPCQCEFENPISVGGEHPVVDRIENFVQAPRRFIRERRQKQEPAAIITDDPQQAAIDVSSRYLRANGLDDVYIDVRRYEPREQWQRLKDNDRISPVWKYTAGSLNVLTYTLFPRRAFHIDSYSPYTNTLSLNSDRMPNAIFAAAEAKEYRDQRWPGVYAVLQRAPLVPLIHSANVSTDVLTYVHLNEQQELADQVYPRAYSKIASSAVSEALFFVPLPADLPPLTTPIAKVAGLSIGRATGKAMAERNRAWTQGLRGRESIAGTALRVLCTIDSRPLKPRRRPV
jgi:hypothetical protein